MSESARSLRSVVVVLLVVAMVAVAGCGGMDAGGADDEVSGQDGAEEPPEAEESGEDDGDGDTDEDDESRNDETGTNEGGAAEGTLEIHAIDVGQADATLLVGPEETMLIDSGDWRDDGEDVLEYLDSQGVEQLDYLVSTHAHADHIGGHAAVIEHYETEEDGIGEVWDPGVAHTSQTYENYLDAVEEHDVDLLEARAGDELAFADGATVLNPPEDRESDDLHDNSLSLRVTHGESSFLATGDAETGAETRLVEEYGAELESDVYQVGHHGSSTSSTPEFLDHVDPEIALISSAYDSQYDHPHDEVLEAFDERGIETYWTAVHGSIVLESDGEEFTVETGADATTDPAEIGSEPPADESAAAFDRPAAAEPGVLV